MLEDGGVVFDAQPIVKEVDVDGAVCVYETGTHAYSILSTTV